MTATRVRHCCPAIVIPLMLLPACALAQLTANLPVTVNLQEVVAVGVTGTVSALTLSAPSAAGGQPSVTDSNSYLRYTSTVISGRVRSVTAALVATLPPTGTQLRLQAAVPTGAGASGAVGVSAGTVILSTTDQAVLTQIGGCKTGTAAGEGARLTYTFSVGDWAALRAATTRTVTVRLTLTDAL
jgi:hypothetical protein